MMGIQIDLLVAPQKAHGEPFLALSNVASGPESARRYERITFVAPGDLLLDIHNSWWAIRTPAGRFITGRAIAIVVGTGLRVRSALADSRPRSRKNLLIMIDGEGRLAAR